MAHLIFTSFLDANRQKFSLKKVGISCSVNSVNRPNRKENFGRFRFGELSTLRSVRLFHSPNFGFRFFRFGDQNRPTDTPRLNSYLSDTTTISSIRMTSQLGVGMIVIITKSQRNL